MKPHVDKVTLSVLLIALAFISFGVVRPATGGSCSILAVPGFLPAPEAEALESTPRWDLPDLAGTTVPSGDLSEERVPDIASPPRLSGPADASARAGEQAKQAPMDCEDPDGAEAD